MALGEIGMSLSDFDALGLASFREVLSAHRRRQEQKERESWRRTRFLAQLLLQPYARRRLKSSDICEFPWERKESLNMDDVALAKERMATAIKMFGQDGNV